ncbi:MAG: stage 0 sporulation family protein [Clostridia bacterium]|nr:stage 0 sporulation family protein [Clostridia bacterium]
MIEIVGVRFKKSGKVYYFDPIGLKFQKNDHVIVETARGVEIGEVSIANKMLPEENVVSPLKPVLRKASDADVKQAEENKIKEKEAFALCNEKIQKHNLDMKLVDVEYTFDRNKILFYFTSDGRVDFRDLVKDLAAVFRTRIELRQIGVRDEAKMVGGLGICGRKLCCTSHLGGFEPVSIKMAKEQNLSLNPTKISGTCSRLMCCLKYEQDAYEDLHKNTPNVGSLVKTPSGEGVVKDVNLLKGFLKIQLKGDSDTNLTLFHVDDIQVIKSAHVKYNAEEMKELKNLKSLEE